MRNVVRWEALSWIVAGWLSLGWRRWSPSDSGQPSNSQESGSVGGSDSWVERHFVRHAGSLQSDMEA